MILAINNTVHDYDTIAQLAERKMNGANVHGIKVDLAVIRYMFMRASRSELSNREEQRFMEALNAIKAYRQKLAQ